jgi:5-methylcytosine-specific restriction endonuclease McrA
MSKDDRSTATKKCCKCGVEWPRSDYSPDKRATDGLQSCCKACRKAYRRAFYVTNRDKVTHRNREWSLKNPRFALERQRRYYARNKAVVDARWTAWLLANPEKRAATCARWAKKNHDKESARVMRRIARKLAQTPSDADFAAIRAFYTERDRLTRETGIKHEVDHIVPLAKGGLHHQDNLQILTKSENCRKGKKL